MRKTSLYLFLATAYLLSAVSLVFPQNSARSLSFDTLENDPVKITSISFGGRTLSDPSQFPGDYQWLRKLTFTVKNVSDKKIVCFLLRIDLENQGLPKNGETVSGLFGVPYGVMSDEAFEKSKSVLAPGETARILMRPNMIDQVQKYLFDNGGGDVTKGKVSFNMIMFDDKTAWNKGKTLVQHPTNPRMWAEKTN
ncbi:MAG: hypothetical protein QM785_20170 [Pyrinomonadaceae bacterium]